MGFVDGGSRFHDGGEPSVSDIGRLQEPSPVLQESNVHALIAGKALMDCR